MRAPISNKKSRIPVQLELPLSADKTALNCGIYWWEKGDGYRLKPANSNDPFAMNFDYEDRS